MNIPANLHYTKDHEWIKVEGNEGIIGITDFAQHQLGDIVFIEVNTLGETIEEGATFGTIEAVKTVSDLFIPVSAEIIEFNEELADNPENVNTDPYGKGWIVKVRLTNPEQVSALLSADEYKKLIEA